MECKLFKANTDEMLVPKNKECELFTDNSKNNEMLDPYIQDREQQNVFGWQITWRTTRCKFLTDITKSNKTVS